jgi:hypothetical protein
MAIEEKRNSADDAERHYQAFLKYHDQGDLELAWREITEACQLDPRYVGSFAYLSQAFENRVRIRKKFGDEEARQLGVVGTDSENLRNAVATLNQFLEYANAKENIGRFDDILESNKSHLAELEQQLRSSG